MAKQSERRTNFEWGVRSAIQKAIRRSDASMLHQAIDVLWRIEPSWIFWRMPVLAAEEVPQLTGETCKAITAAKELRASKKMDEAKQCVTDALLNVCSYKKDKTTWAIVSYLYGMALYGYPNPKMPNDAWERMWRACKIAFNMIRGGRESELWASLLKKADDKPEAIRNIVKGTHSRFVAGGMEGDRVLMAVTSIVAMGDYSDDFENSMRDAIIQTTPRDGDWPWFVYDMHTAVGKRALSYVSKKRAINRDVLAGWWFTYESNYVVRGGLEIGFWFPLYMEQHKKTFRMSQDKWNTSQVRCDLEEIVTRFVTEDAR